MLPDLPLLPLLLRQLHRCFLLVIFVEIYIIHFFFPPSSEWQLMTVVFEGKEKKQVKSVTLQLKIFS